VSGWLIGQRATKGSLLAMDFLVDLSDQTVELARLDEDTIGMWFSFACPEVPTVGAEKSLHGFFRLRRDRWRHDEIRARVRASLRPASRPATQPASRPTTTTRPGSPGPTTRERK
jgi:hypothetical protein